MSLPGSGTGYPWLQSIPGSFPQADCSLQVCPVQFPPSFHVYVQDPHCGEGGNGHEGDRGNGHEGDRGNGHEGDRGYDHVRCDVYALFPPRALK